MNERARQFMPFAALRGYGDIIEESAKIKSARRQLSDEKSTVLSEKLAQIKKGMKLSVIFYSSDFYDTLDGIVSEIDKVHGTLTLVKRKIPFADIYDISGEGIEEDEFFS